MKVIKKKCFPIYEEVRKYLVIYEEAVGIFDFATAPFWISLYIRKIYFSFLSVYASAPVEESHAGILHICKIWMTAGENSPHICEIWMMAR